MKRSAVWILLVATTVSLLADGSSLFAQSAPAATNKNAPSGRAPTNQKTQAGDDRLNAAIAELIEKSGRDPGNPEPHYARAFLEHKAGRVSEAQKSVVTARGLEKKRPIADWGRFMERYQGPSRVWLEAARRKPIEELLPAEPSPPEPVVPTEPKKNTNAGSGRESQPTAKGPGRESQPTAAGLKVEAPKNTAPVLGYIGVVNEQQQLTMFGMMPMSAEEVVTRELIVNGKPLEIIEKKPITVFHRIGQPVPLSSVSISNVAGERLTTEQIQRVIKGDTLVLMSPQTVDPQYLKLVKPDTLIVTQLAPVAGPAEIKVVPPPPKEIPAPAPAPKAQAPAPATGATFTASFGENDDLAFASDEKADPFVAEVVRLPSLARKANPLSRTPNSDEFGDQREAVAMLFDSFKFSFTEPARFPIEAPPVLVFATELDENGTLTTVGSVFQRIMQTVQEVQVAPNGNEAPVAFSAPVFEEQRKLKTVKHNLGSAKFISLKSSALSQGGHGATLNLAESRASRRSPSPTR